MVLKRDSVECEFVNNIITFHEDENTINEIDIDKKTFTRENKDFIFKIDFYICCWYTKRHKVYRRKKNGKC